MNIKEAELPYVTSSNGAELQAADAANVIEIQFPRVTRWFEVRGSGCSNSAASEIRIGFTIVMGVLGRRRSHGIDSNW